MKEMISARAESDRMHTALQNSSSSSPSAMPSTSMPPTVESRSLRPVQVGFSASPSLSSSDVLPSSSASPPQSMDTVTAKPTSRFKPGLTSLPTFSLPSTPQTKPSTLSPTQKLTLLPSSGSTISPPSSPSSVDSTPSSGSTISSSFSPSSVDSMPSNDTAAGKPPFSPVNASANSNVGSRSSGEPNQVVGLF